MPDNGSGAGATFTIEGQDAGGTDTAGGDISIVGGAKDGTGAVGNILLQGGYSSTGVTINPAGNIETKGTLTVDSTSTLTAAVTMSAGLTLNQGNSNVITIDDNKASSLVIKSSGTNANFFTIDTTAIRDQINRRLVIGPRPF